MGTVGCFFRRVQISQSQFREFKFRELSLPPNQIVLNTKISDDKFRECTKNTRNSQKLYSTENNLPTVLLTSTYNYNRHVTKLPLVMYSNTVVQQ